MHRASTSLSSPLRVVMILQDNGSIGGLEASLTRIAPFFGEHKIDVSAVVFGATGRSSELTAYLNGQIETYECSDTRALKKILGRADIAHIHSATSLRWSPEVLRVCRETQTAAVLTVHLPSFPPDPTGPRSRIQHFVRFTTHGRALRRERTMVLTPSTEAADTLGQRFRRWGIKADPTWCGTQDLGRAPIEDSTCLRVGLIGRLAAHKRPDVFLRGVACARAQGTPIRAEIAGAGPLEHELQVLSRELGIDDIVGFHGQVADPGPTLRSVDLLVLTSLTEGLPLVAMEAASTGRGIVVGAALGGTMDDFPAGVHVLPGDEPEDFARAFASFAGDRLGLQLLGAQARTAFEQRFAPAAAVARLRSAYEKALSSAS